MTALTHIGPIASDRTTSNGKRFTLMSLTALALLVGASSGLAYSQVGWMQGPGLGNGAGNQVGALEASRKVRCIMPPSWRKDCGA
jgi:hypothetical protein